MLGNTSIEWATPSWCAALETLEPNGLALLIIDGFGPLPQPRRTISFVDRAGTSHLLPVVSHAPDLSSSCATWVIVGRDGSRVRSCRDVLGSRIAYWGQNAGSIAIGTEPRELSIRLGLAPTEDAGSAIRFLAGIGPFPTASAYQGISELPAGACIQWRNGRLDCTAPVRLPETPSQAACEKQTIRWFRQLFEASVESAGQSRQPLGIMLSGGLDSAPAAAIIKPHRDRLNLDTFAVSWSLDRFAEADESGWIRKIAASLDLELDLFDASDLLPFSGIDSDSGYSVPDFPQINAVRPLILECYRRAKAHAADVILNAAGGDRLYPAPSWILLDQLARARIGQAASSIRNEIAQHGLAFFHRAPSIRYAATILLGRVGYRRRQKAPRFLTEDALGLLAEQASRERQNEIASSLHPLYLRQLLNTADGSAREAAFSRRYGLDRRDPSQSPVLSGFMLNLPFEYSYRNGQSKWIMRQAMSGALPEQILAKGRTGDLTNFFRAGFRTHFPIMRSLLLDNKGYWSKWIKPSSMQAILGDSGPSASQMMLIMRCVGYTLWKQRYPTES